MQCDVKDKEKWWKALEEKAKKKKFFHVVEGFGTPQLEVDGLVCVVYPCADRGKRRCCLRDESVLLLLRNKDDLNGAFVRCEFEVNCADTRCEVWCNGQRVKEPIKRVLPPAGVGRFWRSSRPKVRPVVVAFKSTNEFSGWLGVDVRFVSRIDGEDGVISRIDKRRKIPFIRAKDKPRQYAVSFAIGTENAETDSE
jgi:hypothetical protein